MLTDEDKKWLAATFATKDDLRATEARLGREFATKTEVQTLAATLDNFRVTVDLRFATLTTRLDRMETILLTEFHKLQERTDLRLRRSETNLRSVESRLESVEERLDKLEQK